MKVLTCTSLVTGVEFHGEAQSISSLVRTLVDDDRESQNLISNYRTCAIKGRSRLVASPLRFQAKNDFLLHFYVII